MTNFHSANFGMVCALIGLTLFLFLQSLVHNNKFLKSHLSVFYVANLINQIDELAYLQQWWQNHPWLTNLYIPFLYLLAPSFYLYVRGLTQPDHKHRVFYVKHYLSFFIAVVFCLPYFLLDNVTKLERLLAPKGTLEHLSYITYGPKLALILFIPFTLIYLIITLKKLSIHLRTIKAYFSNIENKDLSWLRWSIITLFIAYIVAIFQLFSPNSINDNPSEHLLFMAFEFIWISIISLFAIQQKSIHKPHSQRSSDTNLPMKYARSQMDDAEIQKIKKRLIQAMEQDKLHRNPSLTLRYLSDHSKISENRISQVLNAQIGMGFYDFINSWRIKDACEMMQNDTLNLLDIAYAVGYNSRSTFNTAFKKHSNDTPSAYRKKIKAI